jgi:hypothetical protein
MIDITFEDDIATFYFKGEGIKYGDSFNGKFKVATSLSPLEYIKADRLRRQLLGEHALTADSESSQYAFMLSQLHYRVIEGPVWWKSDTEVQGGHIKETNILVELTELAMQAEEMFQIKQKEKFEKLHGKLIKKHAEIPDEEIEEESEAKEDDEEDEHEG